MGGCEFKISRSEPNMCGSAWKRVQNEWKRVENE